MGSNTLAVEDTRRLSKHVLISSGLYVVVSLVAGVFIAGLLAGDFGGTGAISSGSAVAILAIAVQIYVLVSLYNACSALWSTGRAVLLALACIVLKKLYFSLFLSAYVVWALRQATAKRSSAIAPAA
jgi:hypothetical protein